MLLSYLLSDYDNTNTYSYVCHWLSRHLFFFFDELASEAEKNRKTQVNVLPKV